MDASAHGRTGQKAQESNDDENECADVELACFLGVNIRGLALLSPWGETRPFDLITKVKTRRSWRNLLAPPATPGLLPRSASVGCSLDMLAYMLHILTNATHGAAARSDDDGGKCQQRQDESGFEEGRVHRSVCCLFEFLNANHSERCADG